MNDCTDYKYDCSDCPIERICHSKSLENLDVGIELQEAFSEGVLLGKEISSKEILGLVNWKTTINYHRRRVEFSIDFEDMLIPEQVVKIIFEQIKDGQNE